MSANAGNGSTKSVLSNLSNKIKYNIHRATYDPQANEFVESQASTSTTNAQQNASTTGNQAQSSAAAAQQPAATAQQPAATAQQPSATQQPAATAQQPAATAQQPAATQQPQSFSVGRVVNKIGSQLYTAIRYGIIPFMALMLSMIVSNEMIVYSAPIRIIFFIFTFAVCLILPILCILLAVFYMFKGGYSYYVNNMTGRAKRHIMPTIFALLPITTYKPISSLGAFFLYPFTYPKTDIAASELPDIMKEYWEDLVASFKDFDKFKSLPIFAEELKGIKSSLEHLHDMKTAVTNTAANTSKNSVAANNSAKPSPAAANTAPNTAMTNAATE